MHADCYDPQPTYKVTREPDTGKEGSSLSAEFLFVCFSFLKYGLKFIQKTENSYSNWFSDEWL